MEGAYLAKATVSNPLPRLLLLLPSTIHSTRTMQCVAWSQPRSSRPAPLQARGERYPRRTEEGRHSGSCMSFRWQHSHEAPLHLCRLLLLSQGESQRLQLPSPRLRRTWGRRRHDLLFALRVALSCASCSSLLRVAWLQHRRLLRLRRLAPLQHWHRACCMLSSLPSPWCRRSSCPRPWAYETECCVRAARASSNGRLEAGVPTLQIFHAIAIQACSAPAERRGDDEGLGNQGTVTSERAFLLACS